MQQGHFHVHTNGVARAKGGSAVGSAAYQSGQRLTHAQQLVSHRELYVDATRPFTLSYALRHELATGSVPESVRDAFADEGIALSEHATVEKKKHGGWRITDGEQTYHVTRVTVTDQLPLTFRKALNKGELTPDLREALAERHVYVSEQATITKHGRRAWSIQDGERTYGIKEHEKKVVNPVTGERSTAERVLHLYADRRHNYTTREDVKETAFYVPVHAPGWLQDIQARGNRATTEDRARVWNTVESLDTAIDSKPALRFQVSFVRALSYTENKAALEHFIREQFTSRGAVADMAIHAKEASDGGLNLHAHILVSTRTLRTDGTFATRKSGYWDGRTRVQEWREAWARVQNTALEHTGSDVRVNPYSYARQGVDVVPGAHLGPDAHREARGQATDRAAHNADIERMNQELDRQLEETSKRVRPPVYTKTHEDAYYAKLEAQERHLYEPDSQTLRAKVQSIMATEQAAYRQNLRLRRIEQQTARAQADARDATLTTVNWFGLGSRTTRMDLTRIRPVWLNRRETTHPSPSDPRFAMQETRIQWFGLGSKTTITHRPGDASLSQWEREALARRFPTSATTAGAPQAPVDLKERLRRVAAWTLERIESLRGQGHARRRRADLER